MRGEKLKVSEAAAALHRESLVADLHSHFLINGFLFGRDFYSRHSGPDYYNPFKSSLSYPTARDGGLDLITFTSYVPGQPWLLGRSDKATWKVLDRFDRIIREGEGKLVKVLEPEDVTQARARGLMAALLAVEGGHVLEGSLENLHRLWERGVRMLTITHFVPNGIADGANVPLNFYHGLSDFGLEVVREMESLGMMVDVAHCSDQAFFQVLEHASRPVLCSHGALRSLKNLSRNLSDDQIRALGQSGGLMGIIFFPSFLGNLTSDIRAVAVHAARAAELIGAERLALGTDMDGFTWMPKGFVDASDWPQVTQALLDVGFSADDVRGILGENFLNYWRSLSA